MRVNKLAPIVDGLSTNFPLWKQQAKEVFPTPVPPTTIILASIEFLPTISKRKKKGRKEKEMGQSGIAVISRQPSANGTTGG